MGVIKINKNKYISGINYQKTPEIRSVTVFR